MIVFKTFWNVVKKYKGTVILYTVLLLVFGFLNMSTKDTQTDFVNSRPDIFIINKDKDGLLTKNLISYLGENSNRKEIKEEEDSINDALFYRDINFVIYIPEDYSKEVMEGSNPEIEIKSTGDYQASLASRMLERYLQIQTIYKKKETDEENLIEAINHNLKTSAKVEIASSLDTTKTTNSSRYFNFASYSIMAVVIFVVCLVMSSFKEKNTKKRIIISSMNYKEHNRKLLLASFVYSSIAWLLFILLGAILLKDILFTTRGLIYMLNAYLFTFCSLTIALLISTLITDKNAVSGIVNVIALGSSFLCGAFVPSEWLPKGVLQIAHALPAYWYINSNDLLKTIEVINRESLKPILINSLVLIIFSVLYIILNNIISKYKQKIG